VQTPEILAGRSDLFGAVPDAQLTTRLVLCPSCLLLLFFFTSHT